MNRYMAVPNWDYLVDTIHKIERSTTGEIMVYFTSYVTFLFMNDTLGSITFSFLEGTEKRLKKQVDCVKLDCRKRWVEIELVFLPTLSTL